MKARFNVYHVKDEHDEQWVLADLAAADCVDLLVIARDREARTIRVECDLPHYVATPSQLKLAYATLDESKPLMPTDDYRPNPTAD